MRRKHAQTSRQNPGSVSVARTAITRLLAGATLAVSAWTSMPTSVKADLIRPNGGPSFPDLSGGLNGTVDYRFDAGSRTGRFQVTNTPFLLSIGPTGQEQFLVSPASDGARTQMITAVVNEFGNLVPNADNRFELYGRIEAHGQIFEGLLLSGRPVAFGAKDLGPSGVTESDIFDVKLEINGGELVRQFGPEVYLRFIPEAESTFTGNFADNFHGGQVNTSLRGYGMSLPIPVPEPASLVIFTIASACFWKHRRRRIADRRIPKTTPQ